MRSLPFLLAVSLLALPASAQESGRASSGKKLYDQYCAQCHGVDGDGLGPAAPHLLPQPRDLTTGKYKIRSTPSGALPTDADLARVIREGMPYTAMPPWPNLRDAEIDSLVEYIKTFSEDFAEADEKPQPIDLPAPPPFSRESAEAGRTVYVETGCVRCHGMEGRGDGRSAPTLVNDRGYFIRAADLTKSWTFRGGGSREDIFRSISTGLNGTPMPAFGDALSLEKRWQLVDFIYAQSGQHGGEIDYSTLMRAVPVHGELDLEATDELFAIAPTARFPITGQIMEPGRDFFPSATDIEVQAVFNRKEIAFRLRWNDIRADESGSNDPTIEVPMEAEAVEVPAADEPEEEASEDDPWGGLEVEEEPTAEADVWGDALAGEEDSEEAAGAGFWEDEVADTQATDVSEFSDAVAIQIPVELPTGIRKPYFLFGDAEYPVDVWFVDLASKEGKTYRGRGSDALSETAGSPLDVAASYDEGQWTVIIRRERSPGTGLSFEEEAFVPIAFSLWDGFREERGNRRGLTQWFYVYLEPMEEESVAVPMTRSAGTMLGVELLLIYLIRRRNRNGDGPAAG